MFLYYTCKQTKISLMLKTLVIVDMQQDFYHPDGALYVKGGEKLVDTISDYIREHKDEISDVVFTLDWHPNVPAAFVENEHVQWPRHCVQYTAGAGISNKLLETCVDCQKIVKYFIKGNLVPHIEYGAFAKINTYDVAGIKKIFVNNLNGDSSIAFNTEDIVICGIAGDYCVLETTKNLVKSGFCDSIELLENGVVSIDGTNETIKNFCNEHKINII